MSHTVSGIGASVQHNSDEKGVLPFSLSTAYDNAYSRKTQPFATLFLPFASRSAGRRSALGMGEPPQAAPSAQTVTKEVSPRIPVPFSIL